MVTGPGNFGAALSWTDTNKASARVKDDRPECSEKERENLRALFIKLAIDAVDSCMGSGLKPSLTRRQKARQGVTRGKTSIIGAMVEHLNFVYGTQHLPHLVQVTLGGH